MWLWPYLGGLALLSSRGSFDGANFISFPLDLVAVAAFTNERSEYIEQAQEEEEGSDVSEAPAY